MHQIILHDKVQTSDDTWANKHAKPEQNVAEGISPPHELCLAKRRQRHLQELKYEQVASNLLEKTKHQNLVHYRAEEEGEECGLHLGQVEKRYRRVVDVAQQEVVYRTVPVARVLVKGYTIPPGAVESAVTETCHFSEHVQKAFPDDVPAE